MNLYSLRALHRTDFDLLLRWRNSERVRSVMFTNRVISREEHLAWFTSLATRRDAIYRMLLIDGRPAGLICFINIIPQTQECTWGFYLGAGALPRGTGSIMCFLGLDEAFSRLGIRKVYGESFLFNKAAVGVHKKLNFDFKGIGKKRMTTSGEPQQVALFEMSARNWQRRRTAVRHRVFAHLQNTSAKPKKSRTKASYGITLFSDSGSWINPYLPSLAAQLKHRGHSVLSTHNLTSVAVGDFAFYLSCSQIVPMSLLARNRHNLVVHESALPKGKGWSPLTWQVLEGCARIPITLFEAESRVDSGRIYAQDVIRLRGTELVDELRQKQADKTMALCLRFVDGYPGILKLARDQKGKSTTYRHRTPKDSVLNIHKPLEQQINLMRVADNERYPVYFHWKGSRYLLKIFRDNGGQASL